MSFNTSIYNILISLCCFGRRLGWWDININHLQTEVYVIRYISINKLNYQFLLNESNPSTESNS